MRSPEEVVCTRLDHFVALTKHGLKNWRLPEHVPAPKGKCRSSSKLGSPPSLSTTKTVSQVGQLGSARSRNSGVSPLKNSFYNSRAPVNKQVCPFLAILKA